MGACKNLRILLAFSFIFAGAVIFTFRGSATTCLKCDGKYYTAFITNFVLFLIVKKCESRLYDLTTLRPIHFSVASFVIQHENAFQKLFSNIFNVWRKMLPDHYWKFLTLSSNEKILKID